MENFECKKARTVAAIHDLSCVGRCALTVVMPMLAAMGIQPCPIPTAVLSTHPDGYQGMTVCDMSDFMKSCLAHWRSLGLRFDAVYSGYLNGVHQAETVGALIDWQRSMGCSMAVVDPVMGDHGRLYSSMPAEMPAAMRALCRKADLITPNMTEVSLLLDEPYSEAPRSEREIARLLTALPCDAALITSIRLPDGRWGNACKRRGERGFWLSAFDAVPAQYPGTGDLFASAMIGALLQDEPIGRAMEFATRFTREAVRISSTSGAARREGVQLELALLRIGEVRGDYSARFVDTE